MLLEASLSGGFVQTAIQPSLLSYVEIEIEVRGEARTVPASVVRHALGGLALEWSEFASGAVLALIGERCEPATSDTKKRKVQRDGSRSCTMTQSQQRPESSARNGV
jgi:hypothetical protein